MFNADNNFQEGNVDIFEDASLAECRDFDVGDPVEHIDVKVFHSGSDGIAIDYVRVNTTNQVSFRCDLNAEFLDYDDFYTKCN